jgi:hypothetical protein
MKKIITTLVLLLTVLTSYSQNFLRSENILIGTRIAESYPIKWGELIPTEVLIKITDTKVTIYSKKTQVYRKIKQTTTTNTSGTWMCNDSEGKICDLSLAISSEDPDLYILLVQYSDIVWAYSARIE